MTFIFFLMIRRPPRSTRTDTLFPYTTLFRSHRADLAKLRRAAGRVVGEGAVEALDLLIADAAVDLEPVGELHRVEQIGGVAGLLPDIMRAEDEVAGTDIIVAAIAARSEERRGGKECVRTCRSRGSPEH